MKYTAILLALNCLVFAVYVVPHAVPLDLWGIYEVAMGEKVSGVPVSMADPWPGLASYMFGHAGAAHLVMNMLMLLMVGRQLEERAGIRLVVIYVIGGLVGALAHMTYSGLLGQDVPLIGASAAVSGVFGAAIAYRTVGVGSILYFIVVMNIVPFFGTMTGFLPEDGVSHVSHLGGAVAGLVFGAGFVIAGCIRRKVWGAKPGEPVDPDLAYRTDGRTGFYKAAVKRSVMPDYAARQYQSV